MYLREPPLPLDAAFTSCQEQTVDAVEQLVRQRHEVDVSVRAHIQRAAEYAARYTSGKRRDVTFAVGDLVLLATTNLPLPAPLSRKLAAKWLGPLQVLDRVGPVAYRLQLPESLARLHPVFHVSLLKPYVGEPPEQREPVFIAEEGAELEVERIAAHRVTRGRLQFLIHWKGYPVWEATWEPEPNLENC